MSMNAQQIADTINAGQGPEGLFGEGSEISELAGKQREVEGRIKKLQDRMERSWQGKGADAARAGAGPLKQAAQQANEHMGKASGLYEEQGDSFNTVKAKVGGGPGPKPEKQLKINHMGNTGPAVSRNEDEIEAWHDEAERIVGEYNKYQDSSMKNSNSWPGDYGRLGLPEGGNDFGVNMSGGSHGGGDDNVQHIADSGGGRRFGPGGPPGSGTPGSNTGPSSDGAGPANHHVSGPGTGSASGDLHGRGDVPAAGDTSTGSAGYTSPGGTTGNTPGSSGYPGAPGYPGGNTGSGQHFGPGGSGAGNAFGPVGTGGHSGSGAPGSGSSSGYGPGGSGAGTRGVPGGTGSGAGSGSGGSGNAGPGRSSGVGAPREGAAPMRGAGSAATGSGGGQTGGGRGMMPGMGGAGRGRGGDEEEHERPSYLEEPDADELFGPDPNDKTVPPVIGL